MRLYKEFLTSDLIKYYNNSRTHSPEQIKQIINSIKEFGFTNPILIDDNNTIIAGHGRFEAAIQLNINKVPCIVIEGLTDAQKRAYVIADNKIALNAGWDIDTLKNELDFLNQANFDVSLTGFSDDEIGDLIIENDMELLGDEDSCPDVPDEPITKPGDIWIIGNHRLMCGDSTSIDAVNKLMNGFIADMVFTDPPYGVEYRSNWNKFDVLENDDRLLDVAPIIECVSRGWVFIWTSWKVQNKWIEQFKSFDYPTNMIVWHKPGGGIGDLKKTFSSDYEVALVWNRGAELCGKRIGSVWTVNKDAPALYKHPTQKPVGLAAEALDKCTKRDSIVLDLFGGSGSTLIACEKLKRNCFMMELDPKYCDVIIKRYENATGNKPILEVSHA